jgi:hypothetical protein
MNGSKSSDAAIPCRLAATVLNKVIGPDQRLQMFLHDVAVCARHVEYLSIGDPTMCFREL